MSQDAAAALDIPGGFMMQLDSNSYDILTVLPGLSWNARQAPSQFAVCTPGFMAQRIGCVGKIPWRPDDAA